MFTVNVKVKNSNPNAFRDLKKRLEKISKKRVVAGFPKGKLNNPHYTPKRDKDYIPKNDKPGPSIIDVAIWNNFGIGVPRRNFMTPASEEWRKYFELQVEMSRDEIITGEINIDNFLNAMGEAGAEFIRDAIVKLRTPPNAPITLKGGWMKKNGKSFKVIGKKSTVPLVDSGDMSKAPIYELRTKTV